MKRILASAVLLLGLVSARAQDYYIPRSNYKPVQSHSWKDSVHHVSYFFSFDMGVSVPMRDYGSRDTTHNFMIISPDSTHGKGFANVGFHTTLAGGVFVTPYMGFCVKIAYNENTFDETTLNGLINGRYTYTVNGNYDIWQFMGGFFGDFPLSKKSSLWVKGMVGLINADFPSFSIYNIPGLPYLSWDFTLQNANNLAYSLSLMYEQNISSNVSVIGTVSYSGAELNFPFMTYEFSGPYTNLPPPYTQHTPVTMSFGSLDFSVGLLFHF